MFIFNRKKTSVCSREYEEQIAHLQLQREITKSTILKIREDMKELIDRAVNADDLDQRILSLDYEEKKETLAIETEHFDDLNKLIKQLRNAILANERCKAFEQIAGVSDSIDAYAVLTAEDTVDIRRSMMREELASLDGLLIQDENKQQHLPQFKEVSEFARLVQEAGKQKKSIGGDENTIEQETASAAKE